MNEKGDFTADARLIWISTIAVGMTGGAFGSLIAQVFTLSA